MPRLASIVLFFHTCHIFSTAASPIFTPPRNQSVINNAVAEFSCVYDSSNGEKIFWKRNGRKIQADTSRLTINQTDNMSVLRIHVVRLKKDEGFYSCGVEKRGTEILSDVARLTIYSSSSELPSGFPRASSNLTPTVEIFAGVAIVTCPLFTGDPIPIIKWYKNHVPFAFLKKNQTSWNGTLQLQNFSKIDAGSYECSAENIHGTMFSSKLHLNFTAESPPRDFQLSLSEGDRSVVIATWKPPPPSSSFSSSSPVSQYKIEYGILGQPPQFQELLGGTSNKFISAFLDKGVEYEFRIAAKGVHGWSEDVEAKVTTAEGVPVGSPLNVTGTEITSDSFKLTWTSPIARHCNGRIVLYEVRELSDSTIDDWTANTTDTFYAINDLEQQKVYSFQVRAYTSVGPGPWSSSVQVVTLPESIVQPPRTIKLKRLSPSELQVSWQPFATSERLTYEVFCTIHATTDLSEWQKKQTTSNSVVFENMQHGSYAVRVRSLLPSGKSSELSRVVIETSSYIPSSSNHQTVGLNVENVQASLLNLTDFQEVLLEWSPPEKTGLSYYQVNYEGSKFYLDENYSKQEFLSKKQKRVDPNLTRVKIDNLHPSTLYKFTVMSCFSHITCGTSQTVLIQTDVREPPTFRAPEFVKLDSDNGAVVKLHPASGINGQITKYYLVLLASQFYETMTPSELTNEELMNFRGANNAQVRKRNAPKSSFIIAGFTDLPEHFVIGQESGGKQFPFYNQKLTRGLSYKVFLRAFTAEKRHTSSPYSNAILIPHKIPEPENTLVPPYFKYVYIVIPICLLLLLTILAFLCLRQRIQRTKKYKEFLKDDQVAMQSEKFIAESADSHKFISGFSNCTSSCRPINVKSLSKVLEELKQNDGQGLRKEYESIEPGQQYTWEVSSREENKTKNRYANVVAYDHTRVKLSPDIAGNDYVNANFIDGYCRARAYIATQGPMTNTTSDFWQMVWEHKCSTIVMLTNLKERNRVKCDQYWPQITELYGLIYVSLCDTAVFATYVVRTLQLTNVNTLEKRPCVQYQFTSWPDQGVPACPAHFLNFLKRVKLSQHTLANPLVVHCSAGVGRTGVFIAADALLERIQYEDVIDAYGFVTFMRSQRNYMIQTEDQYRFLYEVVNEAVEFGATEILADRFLFRINDLLEVNPKAGISEMRLEYKRLESLFLSSNHQSLKMLPNRQKSRTSSTITTPSEDLQINNSMERCVLNLELVNANFVDSYKMKNAFIATQAPSHAMTEEFWKMIWENNSFIIVMIVQLREHGKEMCHQYWPEGRSVRYKYFVVDPVSQYNMPLFVLREFKVTDARDGQSRVIRQFQYTEWPEHGVPSSGESFIEFIGHIQKTIQQFGLEGPVTIHCSFTGDRAGLFMAVNNALERLRYEGIIDIFQAIKLVMLQNPCFLPREEQYKFCYQAVLEYLSSFDHLVS